MCNHDYKKITCHVVIDKVIYKYSKKICSICFQTFRWNEVEKWVSELTEIDREIKKIDVFSYNNELLNLIDLKEKLMGKILEYVDKPMASARKYSRRAKRLRNFLPSN